MYLFYFIFKYITVQMLGGGLYIDRKGEARVWIGWVRPGMDMRGTAGHGRART